MHCKKPALWIMIGAVAACVVVAVCCLTNPSKPPIELGSVHITWANALDLRRNEPASRELTDAQLDELKSRLRTLEIGRKDSDFSGFTPLYSLSIAAQGHPRFIIASYDTDGSHMALMVQNEYYRLDDPDFARYLSAVCAGADTAAAQKALSLDDVLALSERGEALTWADFAGFSHIDTGSGLYIRVYGIDERFSLMIGGPEPSQEPWYIRLVLKADHDEYVDIRSGDVAGFILQHQRVTQMADDPLLARVDFSLTDDRSAMLSLYGVQRRTGGYGVSRVALLWADGSATGFDIAPAVRASRPWSDGGRTESRDADGGLFTADFNFDGYTDIALQAWLPAYNLPYYYWLYDPASGGFAFCGCLNGRAVLDAQNREFVIEHRDGPSVYYTDHYRPTGSGAIRLAQRDIRTNGEAGVETRTEVYPAA